MLEPNFSPFPILKTKRIILRQLKAEDAHALSYIRSNEDVNTYIHRKKSTSVSEAMDFINNINQQISDNKVIYWAIQLKADEKLIGTMTLWNISTQNHRAEIGYELHPELQGKGLMGEAIIPVLRFGFKNINLNSIEAHVDPGNLASIRLLKRTGFEQEGHFKENIYAHGRFRDSAVFSLLAKIWQKLE